MESGNPIAQLSRSEVKKATGWLIALSVLMIVTGILAIAMPGISSVTFTLILGWLLLFNGIVRLVKCFQSKPIRGFWWSLIVGVLYVIAGITVVFNPVEAVITLTWLFGFLLIFEGIVTIVAAFTNKTGQNLSWIVAIDGVITLILGILILSRWPVSAIWLIGFYIGISILMSGIALLILALSARRTTTHSAEATQSD